MKVDEEGFTLVELLIVIVILMILAGIAIFAVSSINCCANGTDPRLGRVSIPNGYKYCDGPNLVYDFYEGGGSVVPNSPECLG